MKEDSGCALNKLLNEHEMVPGTWYVTNLDIEEIAMKIRKIKIEIDEDELFIIYKMLGRVSKEHYTKEGIEELYPKGLQMYEHMKDYFDKKDKPPTGVQWEKKEMETANEKTANFLRREIKSGLKQCNETEKLLFKRMYSHKNLELDIDTVVDNIEKEKLSWALDQINRTLQKNTEK